MNLQEHIKRILKEEISSKDAYSEYGSIKTIVDGKRDVAFTTLYNPMSKLMVLINGLKKIKVVSNDEVNYIVYREGAEDKAEELFRIANKYGGLLHYDATEEDSRRIGQLLNYNTKEIEDYIKHNKNIKNTLKESIYKVLKEDTEEKSSRKIKLQNLIDELGIELASNAVGGFFNLVKILGLEMSDLKTQEMLVKSFIYHADIEDVDILHLEINRDRPDKVRIKIHFNTNNPASNMESWLVRTLCDEINKFFPFKSSPYWEPAFAGRGVTVVLDSEQITNEDDEDEINLQETELTEKCWKGYTQKGMKTMFGKRYPNCVKKKK
jgi:hypothetical protein